MKPDNHCPFCEIASTLSDSRVIADNDYAFLILDGFPVSDGHSLVIPKRHVGSFFQTTQSEKVALLSLIDHAKSLIDIEFKPDAYNIGINDGPAAGQTVLHLHIHLIPRYVDTRKNVKGGVRWVLPEKANYWSDK